MTSEWEILQNREKELMRKTEQLEIDKRKIGRIKESYENHIQQAQHFFEDLHYTFHKNRKNNFYEFMKEEVSNDSRRIMGNIEQNEQELTNKSRNIQQKLDDIYYEKKRISLEEESNE